MKTSTFLICLFDLGLLTQVKAAGSSSDASKILGNKVPKHSPLPPRTSDTKNRPKQGIEVDDRAFQVVRKQKGKFVKKKSQGGKTKVKAVDKRVTHKQQDRWDQV